MELLYKNLHVSYLEIVNSIFSDEEKLNPSVVKEFERFGLDVGMFINEDPFSTPVEEKNCLGIKKLYKFQPISLEKVIETKTKMTKKEITEEKYVTGFEGQYDSKFEVDTGKGGMGGMSMSGKAEYEYSNSGNKFEDSSLKKEDSKESLNKSKSKGESKIKANYSTKPLEEKDEEDIEEIEEEKEIENDKKEENM